MYMMTATLRGRPFGFTSGRCSRRRVPQTTPVPMQFASAVNGEGATDSVTLQHVTAGDTVKVYTKSAGEYTLIGEQVADGSICVLDNLDFGTAEAGRIYYTTTTTAAQESVKMSAPFEAESAEQSAPCHGGVL